ncbi:hypothetical protein D1P53_006297 [Cryptococcus gattii VGV]|nr:hypothetical protein D1P53_006297 [Cryptococcus gattii VGV]
MLQTDLLAPAHADLVTHLTYDYYGERLATCSADQRIKIFRKDENGKWAEEANWKAHDAPILHLSFSHPIHGSLLASCSHDRTIRIWEEPSTTATAAAAAAAASFSSSRSPPTFPSSTSASTSRAWLERGILTGPTGAIRSVQFGPPDPAFGLRVASIATDGYLRVHTSLDPSLNDWSEIVKVHVPSLPGPSSSRPGGAPGDDGTGGTPSSSTGGTGLAGTLALASNTAADGGSSTSHHPNTSELATGGWGLSWCKERWWGPLIAVFAGTSPSIKLISLSPTPSCVLLLTPSSPTTTTTTAPTTDTTTTTTSSGPTQYAPLTCLAWAPNCGRNYHLLATGARDGTIRIWRVEPPGERGRVDYDTEGELVKEWRGQCTGEFGKGGARVGTVDWNAAGTMLSTTDDEGIVRIYKPTYARSWSLLGSLAAEEPPLEDGLNGH